MFCVFIDAEVDCDALAQDTTLRQQALDTTAGQ